MRMKWTLIPLWMILLIALIGCVSQTPASPPAQTQKEPTPPVQITPDSTPASDIAQTSVPEAPAVVPPETTSVVESSMLTQVIVAVSGIHSIADLDGKKLGVDASITKYVEKLLGVYKIECSFIEIPPASQKYEVEYSGIPMFDDSGHYIGTSEGGIVKQEAFEKAITDREIRQALYDIGLSGKQVSEGINFVRRQKFWLGLQYGIFDAVVVGNHASSDLQAMIDSSGARILPWSKEAIEGLIGQFPETVATVLPANTYSSQDSDILGFTISQ